MTGLISLWILYLYYLLCTWIVVRCTLWRWRKTKSSRSRNWPILCHRPETTLRLLATTMMIVKSSAATCRRTARACWVLFSPKWRCLADIGWLHSKTMHCYHCLPVSTLHLTASRYKRGLLCLGFNNLAKLSCTQLTYQYRYFIAVLNLMLP